MRDFDHDTTVPVEVLNGWFVLVRRSALDHVGLLDPQFFMYGEDMDWCYRIHEAGEKVVFFAGAGAIHYGGGSSSNAPLRFYLELYLRQLAVLEKASRLVFPYGIPRQFGPAPPDSTSRRGGGVRLVAVGEGRQRDSHAALPRMLAMAVSSRSQSDRYRDQPREQNQFSCGLTHVFLGSFSRNPLETNHECTLSTRSRSYPHFVCALPALRVAREQWPDRHLPLMIFLGAHIPLGALSSRSLGHVAPTTRPQG